MIRSILLPFITHTHSVSLSSHLIIKFPRIKSSTRVSQGAGWVGLGWVHFYVHIHPWRPLSNFPNHTRTSSIQPLMMKCYIGCLQFSSSLYLFYFIVSGSDHLRAVFGSTMGLSDQDIVALSGGHTLVCNFISSCFNFCFRDTNQSPYDYYMVVKFCIFIS